jgi:hypothetical protein
MNEMQRRALKYIRNAGGSPEVSWFDDDHEPIGPQLRADLRGMGYATQRQDGLTEKLHVELTEAGRNEVANSSKAT